VLNRLSTATDASGATTYGYDAVGNLSGYTYPNGPVPQVRERRLRANLGDNFTVLLAGSGVGSSDEGWPTLFLRAIFVESKNKMAGGLAHPFPQSDFLLKAKTKWLPHPLRFSKDGRLCARHHAFWHFRGRIPEARAKIPIQQV
jgi:YD repeat-containing protein